MATGDVTVRGAGIFGLAVGLACAARGADVTVIDPHGPGAGASGGIVGALAPHTPERWNPKKAFQFESLMMAETFWRRADALSGLSSGYVRAGRLQPIANVAALELARERAKNARRLWQGRADWQVIAAEGAGAWAPVSPTGLLVHDTLSAHLHPARAVASQAGALRALGSRIVTHGPDRGRVIWATGAAGLRDLAEALGRSIGAGVKGQALLLRHDARGRPQLFADALHVVPHDDGTVAVGSTSERDYDAPDTTDAQLDTILSRARAVCPQLEGAPVIARWAGERPRARSRAPMLGPWPGRPGHYVANGGFKIGFGMAPAIAEVMADLVLDDRDRIPDGFRVEDNL